jgi:hypothetical protein
MKPRRAMFLGLAIVLAMASLTVAGCGAGGAVDVKDKAVLSAALAEFEFSAGAVTTALVAGSDSTAAADIKAAKEDMGLKWQKVIDAAEDVEGADTDAAEKAWTVAEEAIDSLPADATLAEATTALSSPMETLMQSAADFWALVGTIQ